MPQLTRIDALLQTLLTVLVLWVCLCLGGCRSSEKLSEPLSSLSPVVLDIEYPDVERSEVSQLVIEATQEPPSARRPQDSEKWPMTLDEAIRIALKNSQVVRDAGGRVVSAPQGAVTVFDPAIQEADPRSGVEAALSAFDAQFSSNIIGEQTDRSFNNTFFGGGQSGVTTTLADVQTGISKQTATGTQFSVSNATNYNRSSIPPSSFQRFSSVFDTLVIGELRHPLLQGSGTEFNRIAGPNATPGNYNGVLMARINSDVSLADFEIQVRNLLRDVETTFWELHFAYRDLDAKREGQNLSLEAWQLESQRVDAGIRTPDQEAFARQQYYANQASVENALSGLLNGTGGVYAVERRLRSLLGLPTSDGRIIVPASDPIAVDTVFDWQDSLQTALNKRVELRRQQWQVKRSDLELVAARNFQKMRVDLVGQYRYRGFGDDLFGDHEASAFDSLSTGNLQEWRVGMEISGPIGNRLGNVALRHAELRQMRERVILEEMERQISHELNAAFTELDRAYMVTRSVYNRRTAALIRLKSERDKNDKGLADLDLVLDAQRQAVDAESGYYRALVDYNLAILNVFYTRGTLLEHHRIDLAESAWSEAAQASAQKLARKLVERRLNFAMTRPPRLTAGSTAEIQSKGKEAASASHGAKQTPQPPAASAAETPAAS
ncbi:MAG: TolC family protein [Planctomycetota bacterium]|nr:TolC family protein [Planctomycetota bacterium]